MKRASAQAKRTDGQARRDMPRVGDAARRLGVGVQTLHYYEREGLIRAVPRSESGYRLYPEPVLERVSFIRKAQGLGLPLVEVRRVLALVDAGDCPCGHVRAALEEELAEVDRRLDELRSFREQLAAVVARSGDIKRSEGGSMCAIIEGAGPLAGHEAAAAPLSGSARGERP